jgi:hypothetical protein
MVERAPMSVEEWMRIAETELSDEEVREWLKILEQTGAITDKHTFQWKGKERKFLHDLFNVMRIGTIMETAPPSVKERYGILAPTPVVVERIPARKAKFEKWLKKMEELLPPLEEAVARDFSSKVVSKEDLPVEAIEREELGLVCKSFMCPFNYLTEEKLALLKDFLSKYYEMRNREASWIYESSISYAPYSYEFYNLRFFDTYGYCVLAREEEHLCTWLQILRGKLPRDYKAGKMTPAKYHIIWEE